MTHNQLVRHGRSSIIRKNKCKSAKVLKGAPQLRGVVLALFKKSPRRPNSANRKVAKVQLSTGKILNAYIPGENHRLQEHNSVLIERRNRADLPGLVYGLIRGALDFKGVPNRKSSRSRYGTKKLG
jgi:small subunit ribosomal protein S12